MPIASPTGNLVLSRKPGETVVIGPNVRVTVVRIRGDQVQLAIEAPRDVKVHRLEVAKRIEANGQHR